ncbi:MAG: helix-turn-helix transcriptional regulator [Anaerolineae bacterium]|jgi:DNA-binding CsgD family transcriptional regulator|nr:helix-turn-helix transcriptional regulator [Anaerolineae bacterium]
MAIKETEHSPNTLTPRQKACLRMTAEGMTARAIAHTLGISVRMVRWHLRQAREHLGASSLAQAVHQADRLGWLD